MIRHCWHLQVTAVGLGPSPPLVVGGFPRDPDPAPSPPLGLNASQATEHLLVTDHLVWAPQEVGQPSRPLHRNTTSCWSPAVTPQPLSSVVSALQGGRLAHSWGSRRRRRIIIKAAIINAAITVAAKTTIILIITTMRQVITAAPTAIHTHCVYSQHVCTRPHEHTCKHVCAPYM